MESKIILGVLCTHNKINKELLGRVINNIVIAADCATLAQVRVIICSWEPVNGTPFPNIITPFRELGHMNYILQLKEALSTQHADIITILEHDVLYPDDYFDQVAREWDNTKYGVWNSNYIGMNQNGYQEVRERHLPMSMLSVAKFYIEPVLDKKLNECVKHIHQPDGWQTKYGWTCVEPDNKDDFKIIPFTNKNPCVHVNMNQLGPWGTGVEGKNHHFTGHCEVCYEPEAKTDVHPDWGDYRYYFPGLRNKKVDWQKSEYTT